MLVTFSGYAGAFKVPVAWCGELKGYLYLGLDRKLHQERCRIVY